MRNVTLKDVTIRADRGLFANEAEGLSLANVVTMPAEDHAMELLRVENTNLK